MGDYDRRSPVREGIGEHFPGMYNGAVHQADGNDPYGQHFVGAVEGKTEEAFLPAVGVMLDKGVNIFGIPYPLACSPFPPAKFEHGRNGAGPGFTHARQAAKLFHRGYIFFLIQLFKQLPGKEKNILAPDA
jgi:hypothetical protein